MSISPPVPNELLLQIFKLADDFKTATSLSCTCHLFQSIWKKHLALICYSILVRTIPCYPQAFEYIRAQKRGGTNYKRQIEDRETEDRIPQAIKVTIRFLENTGQARKALQVYEAQVVEHISRGSADPSRLTQAQGIYFLKAWYRIHTLLSLPVEIGCCDLWTSLNLLEFDQMLDVMCWSIHHCSEEHKTELEIILGRRLPRRRNSSSDVQISLGRQDRPWQVSSLIAWIPSSDDDFILELDPSSKPKPKPRCHQDVESSITTDRWHDLMIYLCSLNKQLYKNGRSLRYFNRLEYFWYFVAHEDYFENEDPEEGICLMDVLLVGDNRGWR